MGQVSDLPQYQSSPSPAQHSLECAIADVKRGPMCEHKCDVSKGDHRRLWTTIAVLTIASIIYAVLFFVQKSSPAPVNNAAAGMAHQQVHPRAAVMENSISSADSTFRSPSTTSSIWSFTYTPNDASSMITFPLPSILSALTHPSQGNTHQQVPMTAMSKRATAFNPMITAPSLDVKGPTSTANFITNLVTIPYTKTGSANSWTSSGCGYIVDDGSLPLSIVTGRCTQSEHASADKFNLRALHTGAEQLKLHKTIMSPAETFMTAMSISPSSTSQLVAAAATTKASAAAKDKSAPKKTYIRQGDCATSSHARTCLTQGFDCVDLGDGVGPLCMGLQSDKRPNDNGAKTGASDHSRRNKLIGGIVGGVGGLLLLLAGLWALWRRKCHKDQRREHAAAEDAMAPPVDPERATRHPAH